MVSCVVVSMMCFVAPGESCRQVEGDDGEGQLDAALACSLDLFRYAIGRSRSASGMGSMVIYSLPKGVRVQAQAQLSYKDDFPL
jgi:hypothetical protein